MQLSESHPGLNLEQNYMQTRNQSIAHSNPFLSTKTSFPLDLKTLFFSVVQADALYSPHWWTGSLAKGDTQDK